MISPLSYQVLHAHIFAKEENKHLLQYLSSTEQEKLQRQEPIYEDPSYICYDDLLDYVHYSWFLPILKTYSNKDARYFLESMDALPAKKLSAISDITLKPTPISLSAKAYFQKLLLSSLIGDMPTLLPINYLPKAPLDFLLAYSKEELIDLIEHLAFYDLAKEIPQIVETKILQKLYSFLSEQEAQFVRSIMNRKEAFSTPPMQLQHWDCSLESLNRMIHTRGLNRFAKALAYSHEHFQWYLAHRLDIGRGSAFLKLAQSQPDPSISEALIQDIETITKAWE